MEAKFQGLVLQTSLELLENTIFLCTRECKWTKSNHLENCNLLTNRLYYLSSYLGEIGETPADRLFNKILGVIHIMVRPINELFSEKHSL